jgi:hypothetical protein
MSHRTIIIDGIAVPVVTGGSDEGDYGAADVAPAPTEDLGAAASSMEARLNDGLADVELNSDGTVREGSSSSGEDMTYRDAQRLREEQREYRERWGSFEKAFSGVSDDARSRLLERAPDLGDDLAEIADVFAQLAPDDRDIIRQVVSQITTDPSAAAHNFAVIAATLRGDDYEDETAQGYAEDQFAPDEYDEEYDDYEDEGEDPGYLTRQDLDEHLQSFMEHAAYQAEEDRQTDMILEEVRDLGYNLDAEDPVEQARNEALFALARRLGGDLQEAHLALSQIAERNVNEYVEGKAADASRPQPPGAGMAPSQERQLETTGDAEAAMRARLDAALGPSQYR